jgi:hypothetical protein
MKSIDKDHAVARTAHQIAAGVHMMLAETGMTVDELKAKLAQFPAPITSSDTVDAVLSGSYSDIVRIDDLSDIAWALGCEWDFHIQRWPEEMPDSVVDQPEAQP